MCQVIKFGNGVKDTLLQALEIPSSKWAYENTDLVVGMPKSGGFMVIAIFVHKSTIVVNTQYISCIRDLIIGYSTGAVSGIRMFNLNLNVRVVCRDILPGLLPDAIYVWNISLL